MEEKKGTTVIATNLSTNIDEIFISMIDFSLNFPSAERKGRPLIWSSIFITETRLTQYLMIEFFTKRVKITGG